MAVCDEMRVARSFAPRELTLPGKSFPPTMPFIISTQNRWDSERCKLVQETDQHPKEQPRLQLVSDTLRLLETIKKPVAVLSICGTFRSGKSYFLSRLLGKPGAFETSHGMQACTRGVWIATTVLECEDFATILLDTEGTDGIGNSETVVMSLLTVTTLLSSYLIYNSKRVPEQVDLGTIRWMAHLSTSLIAQEGSMRVDQMRNVFPHFLWLLRDVMLTMTSRKGHTISPTEFLHTRLLMSGSGQPTELGKFLCTLFPSLECRTLPIPTIKSSLLKNIVEQQERLKPAFNKGVDEEIQRILQQITPKKATNGVTVVDGPALVALASRYVNTINTPGAIPDLEQGWQAVIKWKLKEETDKLVQEYTQDMEECLRDNLPMEERNLKRIHEQVLSRKRESLQQEIRHIDPLSFTSGGEDSTLGQLEHAISQTNQDGEVIGGVLFQFTTLNYSKSKHKCEEVLREVIENSGIHQKCYEAFINSQPLDISLQIQVIEEQYHRNAIGPAVNEVLGKGHRDLNKLDSELTRIPGPPREVRVIGQGPEQVKLSWQPPKENPQAAECYVVWKREKGRQWERLRETRKTKTLITGLKSDTDYEFVIMATNNLVRSVEKKMGTQTKPSATRGALMGAAASVGIVAFLFDAVQGGTMSDGQTLATLIASIICAPVIAPVMAAWGAREAMKEQYSGDLSPESDDD